MRDRALKVAEGVRKELSTLMQEMKDPRIGLASVISTTVSNDLRHARVYVSIYGDDEQRDQAMKALDRANGFLRGELGRRLRLRFAPELDFRLDDSMEHGDRIHRILRELNDDEGASPDHEREDG